MTFSLQSAVESANAAHVPQAIAALERAHALTQISVPDYLLLRKRTGWFFSLKHGVYENYGESRFLRGGVRVDAPRGDGMHEDMKRHAKAYGAGVRRAWE